MLFPPLGELTHPGNNSSAQRWPKSEVTGWAKTNQSGISGPTRHRHNPIASAFTVNIYPPSSRQRGGFISRHEVAVPGSIPRDPAVIYSSGCSSIWTTSGPVSEPTGHHSSLLTVCVMKLEHHRSTMGWSWSGGIGELPSLQDMCRVCRMNDGEMLPFFDCFYLNTKSIFPDWNTQGVDLWSRKVG